MRKKKSYNTLREGGKRKHAHLVVYRRHFGAVPEGYVVHHVDGNHKNNNINNLRCVTVAEHHLIHSNFKHLDGVWHKLCVDCKTLKKVDDFYQSKDTKRKDCFLGFVVAHICKDCERVKSKARMRLKRAIKKTAPAAEQPPMPSPSARMRLL
jgi:hypothetical protein